ncbi:DUF2254 domain-containing protein [Stratiformator vulcanicus]|uniref:DUF2254 domain-containing protein n=1 Tax=Stratiformator vulcanicus TaxID=2527980 RepID=A0A517QXB8_9PLAN|nr:DUF2254 domain-containing protein [Stratiformator vulcanicus]QDT36254.1 hypothetical protein Pan189_06090 [Stratiformator vulcanicus]
MKTNVLYVVDVLRDSFWFLPIIAVLGTLSAAWGVLQIDEAIRLEDLRAFGWEPTSREAARLILTTLIGALVSVTGVVFSVLMLVLAQTSAQLGPRVIRTVIGSNIQQGTLAVLLGTTAFCLVTLRSIRDEFDSADPFLPEIALSISIVAFFFSIGMLIYFVHDVSRIIQVPHLIERISYELHKAITNRLSGNSRQAASEVGPSESFAMSTAITTKRSGYVQAYSREAIASIAEKENLRVRLDVRTGDFVTTERPFAEFLGDNSPSQDSIDKVRESLIVGPQGTPRDDIETSILQISEIGMRALSPGINDPRTAQMCLDRLTVALTELAGHGADAWRPPQEYRLVDEPSFDFDRMLNSAYGGILFYSAGFPPILQSLADGLECIAGKLVLDDALPAMRSFVEEMLDTIRREVPPGRFREAIVVQLKNLAEQLTPVKADQAEETPSGDDRHTSNGD